MHWWIQTRTRGVDYALCGPYNKPDRWWETYLHLTTAEHRTLVVETEFDGRWRLYVTAMDARRQDQASPPRPIRNSLIVHGDHAEQASAVWLARLYLDGELAVQLSDRLTWDAFEEVAQSEPGTGPVFELRPKAIEEVAKLVTHARPDASVAPAEAAQIAGTWTGSANQAADLLNALGAALKNKRKGVFGYLNLMTSPKEAHDLVMVTQNQVGVFLFDSAPPGLSRYEPGEASGRPNPRRAERRQTTPQPGRVRTVILAGAVVVMVAILATLVVWTVFART
jgi:hypothetical protein